MKILTEEIISSTDITNNYKLCREKTKHLGKTIIFKNNTADMVLMDISYYEMISKIIEEAEHMEIFNMVAQRGQNDNGKRYSLEEVKELLKKDK